MKSMHFKGRREEKADKPVRNLMKKVYRKRPWNRAVTFIAGTLVFITTYMLILPAITMTKPVLDCPYVSDTEAIILHQHDAACYNNDGELICTLPERKVHVHDDSCYEVVILGYETIPLEQAIAEGRLDSAEIVAAGMQGEVPFGDNGTAGAVDPNAALTVDAAGVADIHDAAVDEVPAAVPEEGYDSASPDQLFSEDEFSDSSDIAFDLGNFAQTSNETVSKMESLGADTSIGSEVDGYQYAQNTQGLDSVQMVTVPIIEKHLICGREELNPELHVHDDSCYETVVMENEDGSVTEGRLLTCTKPVVFYHQHGEECFKKAGSDDIIVYDEQPQESQDALPMDGGQEIVIYDEPKTDGNAVESEDYAEDNDNSQDAEQSQTAEVLQNESFKQEDGVSADAQADESIIEYYEPSPVIVEEPSDADANSFGQVEESTGEAEHTDGKEPVIQTADNENDLVPRKIEKKEESQTENKPEADEEESAEEVSEVLSDIAAEIQTEAGTELTTESAANAAIEDNEIAAETDAEDMSEIISEADKEAETVSVIETVFEAGTEITTEAISESVSESAVEVTTETINEPASDVSSEITTEAVNEISSDIAAKTTTEASADVSSEASTETTTELFSEVSTEAATEVTTAVLTFDGEDYHVHLTYDSNSGIPENAWLSVAEIDPESKEYDLYLSQAKAALGLADDSTLPKEYARFFDITIRDGKENEIQPNNQVKVEIIYDQPVADVKDENVNASVLHFDEEKNAEVLSTLEAWAEEGIEVSLEGSEEISDTTSEAKSHEDTFVAETADINEDNDIDIASTEVSAVGDNGFIEDVNADLTEPGEEAGEGIAFTTDSFSVFGIIYTVDFHWEVNGKEYEFSIPGGGFVSFTDLVEVLGIVDGTNNGKNNDESSTGIAVNPDENSVNEGGEGSGVKSQAESGKNESAPLTLDDIVVSEAAREFVADVASVKFSNPRLVDVSKAESDITVGEIKENRWLECEYSADLTEEQIEEINNTTVETGDWALVSVHPFTSEEELTVTMKNGEQFVVKVTDAQIHTYVISDSGDAYKITVTYDNATGIPADAELRARLLTPEDDRYQEDIDRSNAALLARYNQETTNPLVFEIKIIANGKEIEPIEGTQVSVEISLAIDMMTGQLQEERESRESKTIDESEDEDTADVEVEEGSLLIDGAEYTLEPVKYDPSAARVVHLADNGDVVIIEEINNMVDGKNNVVMTFETESFSDYTVQPGWGGFDLNSLPSTIYVGDEIYMQNLADYWVTGIGSVVTETKYDGDAYKSVRATHAGTFRICHRNNWNNGNPYQNYKEITILPARPDGNNGQPYEGTTPPATIPTVSNSSIGLTLNLFDYDLDDYLDNRFNNHDYGNSINTFINHGINNGHSLKFWGSGITDTSYGEQNDYVEHGVTSIVNNTLTGGYPTLKSDNTSLDYLFTPSDGTDKKAYLNADGLFKKDGDYYVYNSNQNYAWYNPDTNKFEVYNSTYKQKLRRDGGEDATTLADKAIGFFPFHEWDDQRDLFVNWNKNLNHHFGMSMSVLFSLPKDPKAVVDTTGQPIIFEFSGDDDLWVFIDGKLAMDIGGIHQPTSGTINFQNKTVTVNGKSQSFNFDGLYDGNTHTLQVFYIERGGCDSNCMIKFNLTQYGDVEFDKVDKDNPNDKLGGAVFAIYKDEACTQPLMERLNAAHNNIERAYVAESDANGHVKFSDIPLGDYYLKEIKAPDGYPLDSTVHHVKVYLDANSQVVVKTSIDGIDVVNPGVQIPNKKPDPIRLGLKKEWNDQNNNTIPAPANTSATFELKRIRTYERITEEETVEGHDEKTSTLIVGWYHNGDYHVHKEYTLIAGSTATISWSYVDGYTGSKDCYKNGTLIDKNEANNVISEAVIMPAAGETATLYIVDESVDGEAIKNINVAGEQFYGTSGGGVIHKFETITEPDPDFQYTVYHEDPNVVNNQVTLPVDGDTPWEYDFLNLPLVGRTPNTPTTYSYTYYLEEVSSVSPAGTTVIYKDRQGKVLNSADDAETNVTGTQTITNQVDLGALELTKNITETNANDQTKPLADQKQWVNGTVCFTIDGVEDTFTEGIHHDVEITYAAGKITSYKIDSTTMAVDPAVTGTTYSILVNNLVPGDYVIKETGSSNMTLTGITGGKNDANLTEQTVTVTVAHGKNTADQLDATAKAAFTNNLKTINVPATKTWADLNDNTTHPTIYFRLFYRTEAGDVAVGGVKLKPLPNGTTTVTWENVPKYDQNGQEYVYLVKEYIQKDGGEFTEDNVSYTEAAPNGYVATEEGLSVTNTESDKYDPRTSYTGRKVWVDTANNGATRPENLTVTLMIDKTGDGPSSDDVPAKHDDTPYTPVWNKPVGSNEWTYTFNNLPVYDTDWNIIKYYAVETPVNGFEQSNPDITGTQYVYKNHYNSQHIPNDTDVTISSEIHLLPFMAIETVENAYGYKYHVWTVRVATDAEKAELVRIFNAERNVNIITSANTRFVSGLPVSKTSDNNVEFLYRSNANNNGYKISISKTSGDILNINVDGSRFMTDMIVGTLEYDYSAGSTDLQNTLKTEDYDVQKTWGSGQNPPEGAEVQFTLTATIPGTPTDENEDPDPVAVTDLTSLGISKPVITLNGGKKEGEKYTGDDTTEAPWVYKWGNLPQYDKSGNKITYSASETSYTIDGEPVDITSEGLVPPTTSDATYELITTNRIPTENISAKKYWPEGQTIPEGTHIKLTITAKLEGEADPNGVTITPVTVTLDGKVSDGDENEFETADTLWQYTWTDLPKYNKDGKKIIYTVAETEYKIGDISYEDLLATANEPAHEDVDFSFTNELPVTRITVEKTWSNNGGSWPDNVSVIMTLKGSAPIGENGEQKELETLVLPDIKDGETTVSQTAEYTLKGEETTHTWYNLPMYTLTGKPITYTVDETGMTYTKPNEEPVPIQNWAQAFTVNKQEDAENNKVTIDNTPLETEISLTKVWTLNGQPKAMKDGDTIEFKLYRTGVESELTLSADGYAADKGTPTLNKILYVGSGDNPGWQVVTISKLPKYMLKLEPKDDGMIAYYTGVSYYAVETNVTGNTRISYTLSPMNANSGSSGSGGENGEGGDNGEGRDGGEDDGNTGTTGSTETTDPTQSAIGTGTITIYNRDTDVDISVLKVDATDEATTLPNAVFKIMKWNEDREEYQNYNPTSMNFAEQEEESKQITGSEGKLTFEGLLDGKYKIVELSSPAGYIKIDNNDIYFSIDDGSVTWTDKDGNKIGQDNKPDHIAYDDLKFKVGNIPGAPLPNTGGFGTNMIYLLGIILTGIAGTGLAMNRRRKAA